MIKNYHSLIFIYNIIGTQRVRQIKQFFFCQKIYYYIGKTIKMQTNEFFFTFFEKNNIYNTCFLSTLKT